MKIYFEKREPKNQFQKSFNKAAGLIGGLQLLHQAHPNFEFKLETPKFRDLATNVTIQTNVPFLPDNQTNDKLQLQVYYNGDVSVEYGAKKQWTGTVGLRKSFTGFRASKKALTFIKKQASTAGLIP